MKQFLIISVILILIMPLSADNNKILIQTNIDAVAAYKNKDYQSALDKFLFLENNGVINADLFYNTGNCYFRLGKLGKAVLYYKKSLKVDPAHKSASGNLKLALTMTKDKVDQDTSGAMEEFLLRLYHSFDLNSAAMFVAVLLLLLVIMVILSHTFFRNSDKSLPVFFIFLIIILLAALVTISIRKYDHFHNQKDAVVIASTAIGYSGPGQEYTRVFTIHEGMICQIEDENEYWVLIKLPNGIGGWIEKNLLETVTFSKK